MAEPARARPDDHARQRVARRGTPLLVARFEDMATVRDAMVGLQNAGIDAADIGLVGEQAVEAEERSRRQRPSAADAAIVREIAPRTLRETARIGGIGAAAGLVLGIILWGATGSWILLPIAVVALAAIAAVVGAYVGFDRSAGLSDAWELTFHEPAEGSAGPVWVAVYAGDLGHARDVLVDQGGTGVRRPTDIDALGRLFTGVDTGRRPA